MYPTYLIAQLIKRRAEADLTQKQLADRSGVSLAMVQRYETGKSVPRLGSLVKLAKALNATVEDLTGTVTSKSAAQPPAQDQPVILGRQFEDLSQVYDWATTFIGDLHALTRVPCQQIRTTGTPEKGHVSYMSYAAHGSPSDGPVIRLFFNEQKDGNWTLDDVRVAL